MNNCILMTQVVQDPQLRYTSDTQTPIAEMVVQFDALREGDPPAQIKVIGWGNLGQDMQAKYRTGDRLIIEGRLGMNLVDNPMGYKDKFAELTAQRIHQLSGGEQIIGTSTSDPTMMHNPNMPAPMPPMVQQPMVQQPMVQQPVAQQPMAQQPMNQQPMVAQAPMGQQPMNQIPPQQPMMAQSQPMTTPMAQVPMAQQPPMTTPMAQVPMAQQPSMAQPSNQQVPATPPPPAPTEADFDEIPF
ncbi:MAG: single-stranded DNA-binding protein [Cyanobacteria bacterium P01_F01_bin.150]